VLFLSERYKVCKQDILIDSNHSTARFSEFCNCYYVCNLDPHLLSRTQLIYELVMVRDSLWFLRLSDQNFLTSDVCDAVVFYILIARVIMFLCLVTCSTFACVCVCMCLCMFFFFFLYFVYHSILVVLSLVSSRLVSLMHFSENVSVRGTLSCDPPERISGHHWRSSPSRPAELQTLRLVVNSRCYHHQ